MTARCVRVGLSESRQRVVRISGRYVGLSLGFDDPLGHSRIVGFEIGEDKIALEKSVFKSLAHIDYDAATGALTFDPGAPGGGDRIEFARLARNLAISDGDFVMV